MKKEKVFMEGYKGFNKDLKCRDKQYYENSIAEEDAAEICNKGIHFCKDPAEVLEYYPMLDDDCDLNEFRRVEALDECFTDDNKKFVTKKIKLGSKLSFMDLIKLSVDFDYENIIENCNSENNNDEDYAKIGSSGDSAKIDSTGKCSVIMCAGNNSKAKGKIDSWITLSEWVFEDEIYKPKCVKTEYIDGTRIKEDTWYILKDGKFVEYENNNQ